MHFIISLILSVVILREIAADGSTDCNLNYWSKVNTTLKPSTAQDYDVAWKKCLGQIRGTVPPANLTFQNCDELICAQVCTRAEIIPVNMILQI